MFHMLRALLILDRIDCQSMRSSNVLSFRACKRVTNLTNYVKLSLVLILPNQQYPQSARGEEEPTV